MLEFIQLLNQRYQAISANLKKDDSRCALFQQRVEQLFLVEAFIRKGILIESYPETPLQIAIIGPTQAGKSTVANLILDSEIAGVSPLAGYTVHPQGFCCHTTLQKCLGLQNFFGRFQQLKVNELSSNRYDCYSLTDDDNETTLLPRCVFWDTPDFDSIDSIDYREGVIRAIALADVVVLVVSKEKYADQAVWEMMATIEHFHQPTVICVNKLMEGSEDVIIHSLKEKWGYARKDDFPGVIPLYYQKQTGMPVWPASKQNEFFQLQKKVSQQKHQRYQRRLLDTYWHSWLEPIVAEHEAVLLWRTLVDQSIIQARQAYQRDFLDHPHYYDTFQNALIALLNLLEIPGISSVLTKTRRVLTWPIRKMMGLGKALHSQGAGQEQALLNQIGEHLLISFADQLLEKIDSDTNQSKWWNDIYCLLRHQRNDISNEYNLAVADYCNCFQQDVDATANRLYNKLAGHPIILNSLRATRVTTDAAAMALVIHTGGIGVHDLVITPAMLSVTSLLTESAIGRYMGTVEAELKQHQMETVTNDLFTTHLKQSLYRLPDLLTDRERFNISQEAVQKAESKRKERKHGIPIR